MYKNTNYVMSKVIDVKLEQILSILKNFQDGMLNKLEQIDNQLLSSIWNLCELVMEKEDKFNPLQNKVDEQ